MNRKLHNTLSALMASSFVLVVGLMVANPGFPPSHAQTLNLAPAATVVAAGPAAFSAETVVVARLADNFTAATPAAGESATRKSKTSRIRQSMAMPYFSFAPRG